MAKVVKLLSVGGQRFAEDRLGWNRTTISKGDRKRRNRRKIKDRFSERGRHPVDCVYRPYPPIFAPLSNRILKWIPPFAARRFIRR